MGYEVLVGNLRSAAGEYSRISGALGSAVEVPDPQPDRVGHVELAAWLGAVLDQCDQAHRVLGEGADGLASSLRSSANDYDGTDQTVGQQFTSPFQPRLPFGADGGLPVYGPPAPGTTGGSR